MNHKNNFQFSKLKAGLLNVLDENTYQRETLIYFEKKLEALGLYMSEQGTDHYSPEIGDAFFQEHVRENNYGISVQKSLRTVVRRLNDYHYGNGFVLVSAKEEELLPEDYERIIKLFADACKEKGNLPSTIKGKVRFCRGFYGNLIRLGCSNVKEMDAGRISKSCAMMVNKGSWAVIRELMLFLVKTNELERDYSVLIPVYRRSFRLPTTYSEEEIRRTGQAVGRSTVIGKRDYCIILLASRLGIRAGDIVSLSFGNLDFEGNEISFVQKKTGTPQLLPMLPEIKSALLDYINNGRAESGVQTVFLRCKAPFLPISPTALNYLTTKYLKMAGVDTSMKKHGPHSFRSSLATSMVNDRIPYDAVRKILGHSNPDVIMHYYAELSQNTMDKHLKEWNEKWFPKDIETKGKPPSGNKIPEFLS